MEFFTGAIEKYTAHLLSSISTDYGLNLDELKARYIGVKIVKAKAPKVPMADRPMCSGTVGKKKEPCKNKSRAGETTCHIHGEKPPVDVCQPCKVPQVPAQVLVQESEPSLADSVRNLANIAAEVSQEIKVKKPKKKKTIEAPPPPPADLVEEVEEPEEEVPEPPVLDDLSARLQAMLADGAAFDEDDDEDEEEPESPGTTRHKEILGAKGVAWEEYYGEDDEDEELLEEDEEELDED